MSFNTKINRIKVGLLVGYLVTLFLPIYAKVANGILYKVSVIGLNAGIFFLVFFIVVILMTTVMYFFSNRYHKILYLAMLGFMAILLFMLLFLKEKESMIRSAFYFQILTVVFLTTSYFFEEWTVSFFDAIYKYLKTLVRFIKNLFIKGFKKLKGLKNKTKDKFTEDQLGDGQK